MEGDVMPWPMLEHRRHPKVNRCTCTACLAPFMPVAALACCLLTLLLLSDTLQHRNVSSAHQVAWHALCIQPVCHLTRQQPQRAAVHAAARSFKRCQRSVCLATARCDRTRIGNKHVCEYLHRGTPASDRTRCCVWLSALRAQHVFCHCTANSVSAVKKVSCSQQ